MFVISFLSLITISSAHCLCLCTLVPLQPCKVHFSDSFARLSASFTDCIMVTALTMTRDFPHVMPGPLRSADEPLQPSNFMARCRPSNHFTVISDRLTPPTLH
ncbi:hypothetical protein L226DRAFT_385944 [Lentinus tigrinus ALCF2SS1-7]|uniref:uncharacterized protein n=1 Tax=Lentinus tigrinus ALCF2SS1-7 TaxID=1328758 RepID=UPI0011660364|nr:hypothetical protein L226DRAFT_385944 [Lentinus tigrinus ALCF2SS1-7]